MAVSITSVDASAFPTVDVRVAARDGSGKQMAGLPASAFALTENGAPVPGVSVSEVSVGLQVAFLVIPDDLFNKHDETGASRLEYVRRSIDDFLVDRPWMQNNEDDVSLLTPEGPLILHSTVGAEVRDRLSSYAPASASALAGKAFLSQVLNAVDVARPVGPRSGAASAVFVYASGLSDVAPEQIDLAAKQALEGGVPVYAVCLGARIDPESVGAANLRRLAEGSGGKLVYFNRPDDLSPAFETIAGNRMQYRLTYRSTLAASGQASLAVTVTPPGGSAVTSQAAGFALTLLPPQVTIAGLPPDVRNAVAELADDSATGPRARQLVQVQVAFPDAHPRNLRRLQLLVDDQIVSEVTAPPFDSIAWELTKAITAGTHKIQVKATDELGLSGDSPPAEVAVTVPASASQSSPLATMIAGLAWPAVVVCGLGLVLAVLAAGAIAVRRRGNLFGALVDRDAPALATSAPAAASGVLPQPRPRRVHTIVPTGISATSLTGPAYLEVVEQAGKAKALIDLTGGTITLGRDPASAAIGFADRSVSRLHARIEMDAEGTFRIFDADSTSGTWVNFGQVTAAGQALRHGDLINLGRVQLRFRLRSAEAGKIDTAPIIRPDGERSAAPLRDDTTEPYRLKRKP